MNHRRARCLYCTVSQINCGLSPWNWYATADLALSNWMLRDRWGENSACVFIRSRGPYSKLCDFSTQCKYKRLTFSSSNIRMKGPLSRLGFLSNSVLASKKIRLWEASVTSKTPRCLASCSCDIIRAAAIAQGDPCCVAFVSYCMLRI